MIRSRVDRSVVIFWNVEGFFVPVRPWPQKFVVSHMVLESDSVEVRPLTLTGIAKGVAQNFVTMNFWRLCWLLRGLGFLKTEQGTYYRWCDLTLRCWRYQQLRRFRLVRRLLALRTWETDE